MKNQLKNAAQIGILLLCMTCVLCACSKQGAEGTGRPGTAENQNVVFDLDSFYQNPLTERYGDIRTLDENYGKEQAQIDMCFVIGAMVHNDSLYSEFMERYQKKEDSFIRVVQGTGESGVRIDDILYDSRADRIYLVHDATRDASETDSITLKEFEATAQYHHDGHLYWIAFNGNISDIDLESEEVFIITLIN